MKITWKVVYAFLCFLTVFLIPLAYAGEDVSVFFYKDGVKIETPAVGDKVMLHCEKIGANSSDYISLTLQDSSLKFTSNPSKQTTNVFGRYAGENVWTYETEVEVLTDNPTLPKAQYIRDSSQPELESTEKPTGVSIDLNSGQIVSPGDTIYAKAILEPSATVDPAYYNYLEWTVKYGENVIALEKPRGEAVQFTIPDAALNSSIEVQAVLKGSECGLSSDMAAKTVNLKVNDESLSIQIFPSTDSEGVVAGKYLGFSSELLRNGKIAEDSAKEDLTYWWTAQIGQQFVNGQKRNTPTYVLSPDDTGTLTVYLTVTLKNGITLESNHITKTVVSSESSLESIEIKQLETGEVQAGDTVGVTYTLNPNYVTNLDGAKYEWKAVSDGQSIATSDKLEDFSFTAPKAGVVNVTLTITLKDKDPIESNTLQVNVIEGTPTKIYSGNITTDQDTNNLKVGDTLTLNADLVTEGGQNINYSWKATNESGETLGESNELKDFSVKPDKPENITVTFSAEVQPQSEAEEVGNDGYKAIKLIKNYSFKENESVSTNDPVTPNPENTDNNRIIEGDIKMNHSTTNDSVTDNITVKKEPASASSTSSETDKKTVEKVKTDIPKEKSNSSEKPASTTKQTTEDTTKQESSITSGSTNESNPSNQGTTNVTTGVKTSSLNSAPVSSQQSSPSNYKTISSTPVGSQANTSKTSNVFNKSSNITNPKTGTNFTVGQILVISVCSVLIVFSIILLIRKRRQS